MKYTYGGNQRVVLLSTFLLAFSTLTIIDKISWLFISLILLVLLLLVTAFMRYTCNIDENSITYQITWLGYILYEKKASPYQISHIKYKRYGWSKRGAIVHLEKGFNIRLIEFVPVKLYDELDEFSNKYGIQVDKTKEYKILEKLNWER